MTVIKSCISTHDYNRAAQDCQRGNWNHMIVLNPEDNEVYVSTLYGNGVPMAIHEYREFVLYLVPDGTADATALVEVLESEDIQDRLETVVRGYSESWDGSNYRGSLTENARDILDSIIDRLSDWCGDLPCYWDADEYYMDASGSYLVPLALQEDRQDTVDTIVLEARTEGDYLDESDVDQYLDSVLEDYCNTCYNDNDYCTCDDDKAGD